MDGLHSLGDVADLDFPVATRQVFAGRIVDDLLAMGHDGMGGQTCLRLTGADRGSVWSYDPEPELDEGEPAVPDLLTRVYDRFTVLVVTLEPRATWRRCKHLALRLNLGSAAESP